MDICEVNEFECGSLLTVGILSDLLVQVVNEIVILKALWLGRQDLIDVIIRIQFDVVRVPGGANIPYLSTEVVIFKVKL